MCDAGKASEIRPDKFLPRARVLEAIRDNNGYIAPHGSPPDWELKTPDGLGVAWVSEEDVLWLAKTGCVKLFGTLYCPYDSSICHMCQVKLEPLPPLCDYCEKPATTITKTDKACDDHAPNGGNDAGRHT